MAPSAVAVGTRREASIIADWRQSPHPARCTSVRESISHGRGRRSVRGFSGDGGPATPRPTRLIRLALRWTSPATCSSPTANQRIRKVSKSGTIRPSPQRDPGFSGDGGPATPHLHYPYGVAVETAATCSSRTLRTRQPVRSTLRARSRPSPATVSYGFSGDGGPATAAATGLLYHLAVDGRGALVIGDYDNQRVRRVAPALPTYTAGEISIASEDGQDVYAFDATGRHLRTHDARTGVARFTFGYDPEGRLATVTDGDNNVTADRAGWGGAGDGHRGPRRPADRAHRGRRRVPRDPQQSGRGDHPVHIVGGRPPPNPHHPAEPLQHRFTYDSLGRLTRDEDPAGGSAWAGWRRARPSPPRSRQH